MFFVPTKKPTGFEDMRNSAGNRVERGFFQLKPKEKLVECLKSQFGGSYVSGASDKPVFDSNRSSRRVCDILLILK